MTKPTRKKRGRPRKLPDFMVRLGEDPAKWDKWLTQYTTPRLFSETTLNNRLQVSALNGRVALTNVLVKYGSGVPHPLAFFWRKGGVRCSPHLRPTSHPN